MIVYEEAAAPLVRAGEALVAGRRIAGRLLPYGAESGGVACRFDPVDQRFVLRRPDATIGAGPPDAARWADALARVPSGPVLVGPGSPAEPVRGAFRAAAEAALSSGRAAYLLDPESGGLPEADGSGAVVLVSWRPGRPDAAFRDLASAAAAGFVCAAIFPLLPGWTGEEGEMEALADAAAVGGAVSLTAMVPASDGEGRRAIVEVRRGVEPDGADRFFDLVHHGNWAASAAAGLLAARRAGAARGLAALPPRPTGRLERPGNAAAASRLEELAGALENAEHRLALFHAGVRWIDESGRDLAAIAREGNFRKVFPFGDEVAEQAERALREAR